VGPGAAEESIDDGISPTLRITSIVAVYKCSVTFCLIYNFLLLSAPQEIDEYELVDPVDILTPLEKSGFWEGVVSALFWSLMLYVVM
jgi:hypothetical protein